MLLCVATKNKNKKKPHKSTKLLKNSDLHDFTLFKLVGQGRLELPTCGLGSWFCALMIKRLCDFI